MFIKSQVASHAKRKGKFFAKVSRLQATRNTGLAQHAPAWYIPMVNYIEESTP